jgi:hypothetical protein
VVSQILHSPADRTRPGQTEPRQGLMRLARERGESRRDLVAENILAPRATPRATRTEREAFGECCQVDRNARNPRDLVGPAPGGRTSDLPGDSPAFPRALPRALPTERRNPMYALVILRCLAKTVGQDVWR